MSSHKYFLFSVDTEPDSLNWEDFQHDNLTYRNLDGLQILYSVTAKYKIKPTFFVTHSVASNPQFRESLTPFIENGMGEVGTHFHPGDTPPKAENEHTIGDNILNLSQELLNEKFINLHDLITREYGAPVSYRSGAWTIDPRVFDLLAKHGYTVDSSITPGISWSLIGRPSYLLYPSSAFKPFAVAPDLCTSPLILEIPVSIYRPCPLWSRLGEKIGSLLTMPLASRQNGLAGLVKRTRLCPPLWLRPAFTPLETMLRISDRILQRCDLLHVMCHSNELTAGTSPYTKTEKMTEIFYQRLHALFQYSLERGLVPLTLAEYAKEHTQS